MVSGFNTFIKYFDLIFNNDQCGAYMYMEL